MIERRLWWIVAGITAAGLALRIAAAQGGLWLDEAWSAVMADQAGTPLGVFLNINHDNNHHLNTLWLQLTGPHVPPWLQRGLSIATGTATIAVAAMIGARRGALVAILSAAFFAASPVLVTYGSEARGYAPMLLAFTAAILLIDRWLDDPDGPAPAIPVALLALLGLLAQLSMAFGLVAIALWAAWNLRARRGAALRPLSRAFLPAVAASAIALVLVFLPTRAAGGMAFGAIEPFTLARWAAGMGQALHFTFGDAAAIAGVVLVILLACGTARGRLASLGVIALLSAPLIILLGHFPNAGVARLYLTAAVGGLFLLAALIDNAARQGQKRLAAIATAIVLIAMTIIAARAVIDRRADPARALAAIAARAPAGAEVAVERHRSDAILIAAAASARYPLVIRQSCPAARFLFVERDGDEPFPTAPRLCNASYREIVGARVRALSGTHWKLYERLP